jgi:transposase
VCESSRLYPTICPTPNGPFCPHFFPRDVSASVRRNGQCVRSPGPGGGAAGPRRCTTRVSHPPPPLGRPRLHRQREAVDHRASRLERGDRTTCSAGTWRVVPEPDDPTPGHFEWFRLPPAKKEFRGVLPRRWVVERSFAWLGQNRRLSKDHERLCTTSAALIYAVMCRLMLRRLAR